MVGKLKLTNCDYIPLEIQEEIMKRLPVKSLLRFRSVSKPWNSLIHNSKFIADYRVQKHRLLVVSYDPKDINFSKPKYVSIVDDDTFPNLVVLWNPTISKSVNIDVSDVLATPRVTVYGFGVCPVTFDPKLVRMRFNMKLGEIHTLKVFTLSSGVWRSPRGNLPRKSICITLSQVYIDGCIYLEARDHIRLRDGSFKRSKLIVSFATASEDFTEISYPDSLALEHGNYWISKLRESLAVIGINPTNLVYTVWMMNHGDPKSFTKIYNINLADASLQHVFAFTASGEAIVKTKDDVNNALYVYEPNLKQIRFGISHSWYATCYTETLLLLDHIENIVLR